MALIELQADPEIQISGIAIINDSLLHAKR
jgi:hypothetical protein